MKVYQKGDRIPVRAQQIWLILTAHAVLKPAGKYKKKVGWSGWRPGLITFGDIADQMGMNRKAGVTLVRHVALLGYYCQKNDLPPINVIAVNGGDGLLNEHAITTQGPDLDQKAVWEYNWFTLRPPTIRELTKIYEEKLAISRS